MKDVLAAALAGKAALVVARDVGSVADIRLAAQDAAVVLVLIDESVPKLDKAMLVTGLGPLAVELAPSVRIVAIQVADGASGEDVLAAAGFLANTASVTGQVLSVGPR